MMITIQLYHNIVRFVTVGILFNLAFTAGYEDAHVEAEFLKRVKRVIGGQEVQEGKWPWLVSLQGKIPELTIFGIPVTYRKYYCGASLLNERWIMTAAHCFLENTSRRDRVLTPRYWHARLGDIDLDANLVDRIAGIIGRLLDSNSLRNWYIHAEKIVIHPDYNARALWANDIALVKLEEAVPADRNELPEIQSVKLPQQGDNNFPRDGDSCIMKGWGCTANGGQVSETAREVTLPKISERECRMYWGISGAKRLCAGHNLARMGICSGDSGGPLVCQKNNTWLQAGIASFTSSNRPGNVPGVFTRVSEYISWIRATIARN